VTIWKRIDATLEQEKEEELADEVITRARRKSFRFSEVNILTGAELVYVGDETNTCKVVGDKKVEYEGQHYSLSGLAIRFRRDASYETKGVQGTLYFEYNN